MRKNSVRKEVQDVVDIQAAECTGRRCLLYLKGIA